tara:strand:- start:1739 stop:4825 length:3087 start_codon:yes stop_codon:yes gene_type:complete
MRTLDGRLLADLNDNLPANITGSVDSILISSIDENATTYSLFPERINVAPYISSSIFNTSTPQIKPIQFNEPNRQIMFVDAQGVVKVAIGSSFTLRLIGEQPPILNIENGIPTTYFDQTLLTYEWQKDGAAFLSDTDKQRPNSNITVGGVKGNELVFTNISAKFAGTYACVVSNDIGSTESEQVIVEVYNPDIEDIFYKNLVENPYGKTGVDGWSGDSEFTTGRLSNTKFKNFSQPWNLDLFGYSIDMMYPRPYHINTYHIKNSSFSQDLLQEGYYFTRERFKYALKDGKATIKATYDVDLTSIQEYIQGSIYGIDGVRAVFGCYIGNAITKYRVTMLNALITKRSSKYSLLPNIMRLNILNCLLAGTPKRDEEIRVTIQEFDNETPLLSNGTEPGHIVYDAWTKIDKNPQLNTVKASDLSPGGTEADKIIVTANSTALYPTASYAPTYGQFVEFNRHVISKLNFKTTKVRINITFDANHDVLTTTARNHLDNSDECFEFVPWEWIQKVNHWPYQSKDFETKNDGSHWDVDGYNTTILNIPKSEPDRYATLLGFPRAMVTGVNLVLLPIEQATPNKSQYYTDTILSPISSEQVYPKLEPGSTEVTKLGAYISTLISEGYDYEIVGTYVRNRWNQPTSNRFEDFGNGDLTTRTSVYNFKYDKNAKPVNPEPFNFSTSVIDSNSSTTVNLPSGGSNSGVWRVTPMSSADPALSITNNPTEEIIVIYNSGSNKSLVNSNLNQVVGNIQSRLLQFGKNYITEIPTSFVTQSFTKRDYLVNMGFYLNLEGEDRGIVSTNTTALNNEDDWKRLVSTQQANYYYRVLPELGKAINSSVYTPNIKNGQHIVYSSGAAAGFRSSNTYFKNHNFVNLSDSFDTLFTRQSTIEGSENNPLVITSTFDYVTLGSAGDPKVAEEVVYQQIASSINISDYTYKKDNNTTVNALTPGLSRNTVEYTIDQYQESRQVGSITFTDYHTVVTGSYTGYTKTMDKVKLNEVESNGPYTPSAIIFPDRKKIIYFLYAHEDNYTQEKAP